MSRTRQKNQATVAEPRGADPDSRRRTIALLAALVLLPLIIYGRVAGFEFVNYDDWEYVRDNPFVTSGLKGRNVVWAFTTFAAANWHPLTYVSLMLDSQLFGMRGGAFHAVNLLFHVTNTLLLFAVVRQMTGCPWKSAFVAALFSAHPQHVESVVWITERKDVLSVFFGLCAVLAYLRYIRLEAWKWYLASVTLLVCSLMSKPTLVTFPFLLLLLDWWPLARTTAATSPSGKSRSWKFLVLEKLPYLIAAIVFCFVVIQAQGMAVAEVKNLSLAARLSNSVVAYVLYLYHVFWPAGLAVIYPHPGTTLPLGPVVGATVALVAVTAVVVAMRRSRPYLFVGWFWFAGTMVPMIGIVQVGMQAMADRYSYFPCIGLYLAFTWLAADLVQGHQRAAKGVVSVAIAIILILSVVAWKQVGYWRNSETLFRRALSVTTNNPVAHVNLAQSLHVDAQREQNGDKLFEAIDHYREAVRMDSLNPTAHKNLAQALSEKSELMKQPVQPEDLKAAIVHFRRGLELQRDAPDRDSVHFELGNLLADLGQFSEAADEYRQAIGITPDYVVAYLNLSRVLAEQNRFVQALDAAQRAVKIDPKWQDAVNQLSRVHRQFGTALASRGELDGAIEQFRRSVKLTPNSSSSYYLLAKALAQKGEKDEAIERYKEALARRGEVPEAHYELGILLLERGERKPAVFHLQEAVRLKPDYADAQRALERAKSGS